MQRLGKYEIISEIGRGAMGSVYKARDPLIDRLVALKTITSGISAQANSLERFYQEARSVGALQHPHIVTIYELSHENNTPFIAMEYIEGGSLDHLIEQRLLMALSVKLGFMVRVCEALSYAHGHNVVHRDIKPGNIMVTKDGVVKVVDFGIARLTDMSLTQPNMMIGSRAYMSPQLYKGERADARADIWAVGVTLYELLAYRRPFTGDNEAELMYHIISDKPPDLASLGVDCPEELWHIIERMLEKKADDRYQSMEDVLHDLEPVWKSAQQVTVAGLIADCEQLVAANDLQRAHALLRKALQIDVGNTQAKTLLEKVTLELRRTQLLPKLNEHLERGRSFLQSGKLREARSEVEAALGLDSKHEPAQRLFADVEMAAARVLEVEQKLRLTKQRLAEGALTEAATALGQALELDRGNPQARELHRQIDEERIRREKRKKVGELLHHARTLWTGLNYDECLKVVADGLKEFPDEPELLKLQEMTRHDLEELQKQRQMGEVRKLLGQEEFAQARKIIDALAKKHPQDSAVKNLQTIATDGEQEQARKKKLAEELTVLRGLVAKGQFGDAVSKGDALLREFPEEFELKELVGYVRGEIAVQEQKQKEKDRETRIEKLMEQEKYAEAEQTANRAAQEFPKQEVFRSLAVEAGKRRQEQELRQRTRQEMQRQIDKVSKQEADQNHRLSEAQTFLAQGDFTAATATLNHALATQIFDASDARVQEALQEINRLASAAKLKPARTGQHAAAQDSAGLAEAGTAAFSATMVGGGSRSAGTKANAPRPLPSSGNSSAQKTVVASAAGTQRAVSQTLPGAPSGAARKEPLFASAPAMAERESEQRAQSGDVRAKTPATTTPALAVLRRPLVLAGIGAVALIILLVMLLSGRGPSKQELQLRDKAVQLWSANQYDDAEQSWRQLEGLHGRLQKEAGRHVSEIGERRSREQQRFEQGMALKAQDVAGAQKAFQEVQDMNLWHVEDARRELAALAVPPLPPTEDPAVEEKAHFDRGEQFFQSKNYDLARKEFIAVRDLNLTNSTSRPEADKYLRRIKQIGDDKNLFDVALQDIKNENWTEAHNKLQQLVGRKGSLSGNASQKLAEVAEAEKAQDEFRKSVQKESYSAARSQVDAMVWPKTKSILAQKLQTAQRKQLDEFETRANGLSEKGDADGLERLEDELRIFGARAEDADVKQAVKHFDDGLRPMIDKFRDDPETKKAFEAAVADFNKAKQNRDRDALEHRVRQQFQALTGKKSRWQAPALAYVNTTIPDAIIELTKNPSGKILLPPLSCVGGGARTAPGEASLPPLTCAQLDAGLALQWSENYMLDFPESAKQPGKLPYTLKLMVTVDPTGKVKVDKDGNVDKDFLKKAKDASKNWKTTIPNSGGKPVSVKFPLAITF